MMLLSSSNVNVDAAPPTKVRFPVAETPAAVCVAALTAPAVRIRLTRTADDAVSIVVTDPTGAPVASIDSLVVRKMPTEQLGGGAQYPRREAGDRHN